MSKLEMEICTAGGGGRMTIAWANEEEYQLGKKFVLDMGALWFPPNDPTAEKPAFVYLEKRDQLNALFRFRKSLREKRK